MYRASIFLFGLCFAAPTIGQEAKPKQSPLEVAKTIDGLFEKQWQKQKVTPSAVTDDAAFIRRVTLDITGKLPKVDRVIKFLEDSSPDKRTKLIDELLASPEYGKFFGSSWRNLMIRPDANMPNPPKTEGLADWLAEGFNSNHGWDRIITEMLTAEGATQEKPGTFFLLNGDGRANPLANVSAGSVAKLFMGVNLECAECHKHPFANWKQEDFWGLAAFFGHVNSEGKNGITEVRGAKGGKRTITIKTGPGASIIIPETSFKSVGQVVPAKFPQGDVLKEGVNGPLRPAFAKWLVAKENPYFAKNAANRLWGHFLGKTLVDGKEDSTEGDQFLQEILGRLTKEMTDSNFDQKHLIRTICNTKVYQLASRPAQKAGDIPFAQGMIRVHPPEVLYDALCQTLELPDLTLGSKNGTFGKREPFIAAFTTRPEGSDPSEYAYGIPQVLVLLNQPVFSSGGKLIDRLMKEKTKPQDIIEMIYLVSLSRKPSEDEVNDAITFVNKRKTPKEGYSSVLWAIINSNEFIVNR